MTRLIDADKLKEKMSKYIVKTNHDGITLTSLQKANNEAILDCISFIDNAPTVETFTKDEYEGAYLRGYVDSAKANERPKGEWILVHPLQPDDNGAYMCSECKTGDYYITENTKFCPFCGADMRGEQE